MLATRKRAWSSSVSGVERRHRRWLLGGRECPLVHVALAEHALDAQPDHRGADDLGRRLVGLLLGPDVARAGQVGRHLDDDVDFPVGQRLVGGHGVRVRHDHDLPVELSGRRLDRVAETDRRRRDGPDPGRLVLAEQECRDDERADHDDRGERDAEDEPRLRPRSRISRLATSQMLRQRGITPPPASRPRARLP